MSREETVIWRSKYFPRLVMTREHLEVLRYAYPNVRQFEPELRKAEAWLWANPGRRPKRGWKRFIDNWMKNANEFVRSKRAVQYGDSARELHSGPRELSEILGKIKDQKEGGGK